MNNLNRGFTNNSVIFLFKTFKNWSCPGLTNATVTEIEIQLFLEDFVKNSHAKRLTRKEPYRYKLNESGLIEIAKLAVNKNYVYRRGDFLFAFSYLENYSPRTFAMMKNKGNHFPYNTRLELENFLDLNNFIDNHSNNCKKEVRTLLERIELSEEIMKFFKPLLKNKNLKDAETSEIIKQIEKSYPYALHSTLELANFLEEFTDKQVVWEATTGMKLRKVQIWKYEVEQINLHIKQLQKLKKEYNQRIKDRV